MTPEQFSKIKANLESLARQDIHLEGYDLLVAEVDALREEIFNVTRELNAIRVELGPVKPALTQADCADCGAAMNTGEARTFTVCDSCWVKRFRAPPSPPLKTHNPGGMP